MLARGDILRVEKVWRRIRIGMRVLLSRMMVFVRRKARCGGKVAWDGRSDWHGRERERWWEKVCPVAVKTRRGLLHEGCGLLEGSRCRWDQQSTAAAIR